MTPAAAPGRAEHYPAAPAACLERLEGLGQGGFISVDMRATCTGTGGQTDPCTIGRVVYASPGDTFIADEDAEAKTHSMTMVWSNLKRGQWRFEVLAGGDGVSTLTERSFVVEAFRGL